MRSEQLRTGRWKHCIPLTEIWDSTARALLLRNENYLDLSNNGIKLTSWMGWAGLCNLCTTLYVRVVFGEEPTSSIIWCLWQVPGRHKLILLWWERSLHHIPSSWCGAVAKKEGGHKTLFLQLPWVRWNSLRSALSCAKAKLGPATMGWSCKCGWSHPFFKSFKSFLFRFGQHLSEKK